MKTPLDTEVDLRAGHIVLDGFSALRERGTAPLPLLGPCLLWPRSPISATAELLLNIQILHIYVYLLFFSQSTLMKAALFKNSKTISTKWRLKFFSCFGRPFVKRFALCYRTVVCLCVCLVTLVYCGQTVMNQDATWYGGRPRAPSTILDNRYVCDTDCIVPQSSII